MRQIVLLVTACFALLSISGCGEVQPEVPQYNIGKIKRVDLNSTPVQSCRGEMSDAEFEKCVSRQLVHYKTEGKKYREAYLEVTE